MKRSIEEEKTGPPWLFVAVEALSSAGAPNLNVGAQLALEAGRERNSPSRRRGRKGEEVKRATLVHVLSTCFAHCASRKRADALAPIVHVGLSE